MILEMLAFHEEKKILGKMNTYNSEHEKITISFLSPLSSTPLLKQNECNSDPATVTPQSAPINQEFNANNQSPSRLPAPGFWQTPLGGLNTPLFFEHPSWQRHPYGGCKLIFENFV